MELLVLKIALILVVGGCGVFVADYTRMTRGAAWRDPIGQTVIIESVLLAAAMAPLLLAAFFHLSVLGNEIGAWVLIGCLLASGLIMLWRTAVFEREYRKGKKS